MTDPTTRTDLMDVLHGMAGSDIEAVRFFGERVKYALTDHDQAVVALGQGVQRVTAATMALSERLIRLAEYQELPGIREVMEQSGVALAAATADRDDARRELAEQKRINASNLRVMTEQLELARQTIADAPHDSHCAWLRALIQDDPNVACDCWKAGL